MQKPIKALFVFPAASVWGGEKIWLEFLRRVDKNKITPFCLVFGKGELLKELERINVGYYSLSPARIRNIPAYLRNFFKMLGLLKKEKFDIANSLGVHLLSTLSASLLNIPYVLHIHTIHRLPLIDRWCIGRAKNIVTVSNFSKNFLMNYGVKPQYIEVVYNGIDIKESGKESKMGDIRRELRLDKDASIVCYAGRIVKWKNLDMLIKAIPKVKREYAGKVDFIFVGQAPQAKSAQHDYKESLLKLAKELGVQERVIFMDRRPDIMSILKQIDIFAIPSCLEVCSMSILEAMALGKSVVAVKAGGNPELITEGAGVLVEPKDIEGFAYAILGLLKDKEKRQNMGDAARKRIEEFFTIENNINRWEEITVCLLKESSVK